MRVITEAGEVIDLGITEAAPTIGIADYSRRVTDDFGVTTVVQRGFSRTMSVRLALPFDQADTVQRRLADLRSTPAEWIADDRFASLRMTGFYKDLSFDLAMPPISYCTLTVEGLVSTEVLPDSAVDPAPGEQTSTLRLLTPAEVNDAALIMSSVAENDAPEWRADVTYPAAAQVTVGAAHRIYESLIPLNAGKHPVTDPSAWLDVGPTNRWAMFDAALGTVTRADKQVSVSLSAGVVDAVALIDIKASTVRVQTAGYDRTVQVRSGTVSVLDLLGSSAAVTITVSGDAGVEIGTLLIGRLASLGITEASPTASITDFSRKQIDDFGEVTIVKRAFAKNMTARALLDSATVDVVAARIANVRARPCLWIGQDGIEALTIYGFFKEFSVEIGETLSKLSLSIEGMSAAATLKPLGSLVDWPDIADPHGTKPADNATNSGDPNSPFGSGSVGDAIATLGKVVPIELRIDPIERRLDPIESDVSALEDAKVEHDQALDVLGQRLDPAERNIAALTLSVADQGAIQRQAERAAGRLDETLLRSVMDNARTREILRDAGVEIDAATGIVRLYAIDQLRDRTSTAEQTIDAVKGIVSTKASIDQVNEAIALAVLDPSQIAELQPLIARLAQAETEINAVKASVTTRASIEELTALTGRVRLAETSVDALTGQIASKAEATEVTKLGIRLGSAEQILAALPDSSSFSVTLRQARGVADDAATAGLRALLSGDAASRYQLTQIAQARQEITTSIVDGFAAAASATQALSARTGANEAALVQTSKVLADVSGAYGSRLDTLELLTGNPVTGLAATRVRLTEVEEASATADEALGRRIGVTEAVVNDQATGLPATRAQMIAGQTASADRDEAIAEDVAEIVAEISDPNTGLPATLAQVVTNRKAQVDGDEALSERIDAQGVVLGDQGAAIGRLDRTAVDTAGGLASATMTIRQVVGREGETGEALLRGLLAGDEASRARVAQLVQVSTEFSTLLVANEQASAVARQSLLVRMSAAEAAIVDTSKALATTTTALTSRIQSAEAVINDPVTGLAATRARQVREEELRVEGDAASGRALALLEGVVTDASTGLPATRAAVADLARVTTSRDDALAERQRVTEATIDDPATGLAATRAGLDEEAELRVSGDEASGRALALLDATVNDPATGLPATAARLAREEIARVNGESAQATRTDQLIATATKAATDGDAAEAALRVAGDKANADALGTLSATVTTQGQAIADGGRAQASLAQQVSAMGTGIDQEFARSYAAQDSLSTAIVDGDKANASRIDQVTARLDGVGSVGVEQAIAATVNRLGKLEGTYTIKVDVNGNVSGIQLLGSDSGPGQLGLFNVDLSMGTGRVVFNNGYYMLVQGVGFGAERGLLEWWGQTRPIDTCTPANAISFKNLDGRERMGGAIASGAVGYDELQIGAVTIADFYTLPVNVTVNKNNSRSIMTKPFTKLDAASVLKIEFYGSFASQDDFQFNVQIKLDGTQVQLAEVNQAFDGSNSGGKGPVTIKAYVPGVSVGSHSIEISVTNLDGGSSSASLTVRAGSTIELTELRKAALSGVVGAGSYSSDSGAGGGSEGTPVVGGGSGGGGGYTGPRPDHV